MKSLFIHLLVVIIGTGTATFSQTVTIGTQVWMTRNLDVTTFRNGDPIPEAKTDEEWYKAQELKQPAWNNYDNDPKNGTKYGKLYNWYAVNDPRGLAPAGWHIASDEEWTILEHYLGPHGEGNKMKSTNGWDENGNGTNSSGFNGLPGGDRIYLGSFNGIGLAGYWWSSTEYNAENAWTRTLFYDTGTLDRYFSLKEDGFSVRCVKD